MFRNEPFTDFTLAESRESFREGLAYVEKRIQSRTFQAFPIIAGKDIKAPETLSSLDPSDPSVTVGNVHMALESHVQEALSNLIKGMHAWERTDVEQRASVLKGVASRLRRDKFKLSALIVREAGKPWKESDGDVAEAIDFCDYYAYEMLRLGQLQRTTDISGEDSFYCYQPRGIVAVISPWNFPLAIACGMTAAALVAGNAAILKPAEQTSLIAYEFAKILLESGVPSDAFAFLPGRGEIIGRALVDSPLVDMICFTGSKAVGLEILSRAATVRDKQKSIKKVVAELGGKNAIIVDEDADLDEAVKGVIYSAFGYAGQKCSACSRLIAVGDAYEPFLKRLCDAASDILVGPAEDSSTLLGPVIDGESQRRILSTIARAEKENTLAFKGSAPAHGHFVPATIFRDVARTNFLWREEVFGPVLACCAARDFEEALDLANDSEYALTGGLFSRSPNNIALARREFKVGNLYINRGCTGALVCRHPFGGFRMSGVGSKAGGPDYLLQFLEPRTITENTMRRGFAPEPG